MRTLIIAVIYQPLPPGVRTENIYCTFATRDLASIMLGRFRAHPTGDSQSSRKNAPSRPAAGDPLYRPVDCRESGAAIRRINYDRPFPVLRA